MWITTSPDEKTNQRLHAYPSRLRRSAPMLRIGLFRPHAARESLPMLATARMGASVGLSARKCLRRALRASERRFAGGAIPCGSFRSAVAPD